MNPWLPPKPDPARLGEQLCEALSHIEDGRKPYRTYLAAILRDCLVGVIRGDRDALDKAVDTLDKAFQKTERFSATFRGLEAAACLRDVDWFLEIAREALEITLAPPTVTP